MFERAVLAAPFCLELWEAFADDVVGEVAGGRGGGRAEVEDARRYVCGGEWVWVCRLSPS